MGYVRYSNFVNVLRERASLHPDKVIFTYLGDGETESECLTYLELDEQARAIATYLQQQKGKGERALLLYQPGLEFICAFLGCLYAGVIATPAYPPRPNRSFARLESIIKDAGAKFALTTESLKKKIEQKLTKNTPITCLATDNVNPELANDWQESKDIQEKSMAFLQYTSGSTGTPKGVMVSHGNLIHNSYLISQCFGNISSNIGGSWLPPYHDMGLIGGILQPIYADISTIMLPPVSFLQRPIRWLRAISKYKITTTGGPNFAYEMCINSVNQKQKKDLDLSSWELAFSGAEPVRAETINKFSEYFAECGFRREAFYPCYGMAETTLIVSGADKNKVPVVKNLSAEALTQNKIVVVEEGNKDSQTLVSSGRIASELTGIIVNPDTLVECKENQVGEIWISGDSVTQGYWQRKDLTKEIYHAYTQNSDGPFLRTGDLGFLSEGELFVTGRLKDLIIIRGRNHYPQDIEENVGNCHEAINSESGAAFAVDIEDEEQLIVTFEAKRTFLRKIKQDKELEREIFNCIRQTIAENHELQVYEIVLLKTGSIPKTSSGKIARHACKRDFLNDRLKVVAQMTTSQSINKDSTAKPIKPTFQTIEVVSADESEEIITIQNWLKENIARRLGLTSAEIDVQQPFVNYGLDSMQAVRLTAELEDWLDIKLSPTLAYDYPNIQTLAAYLASQQSIPEKDIQPTLKKGTKASKIAIVGMACRFPQASNCDEYWQLLSQGKDSITKDANREGIDSFGGYIEEYDQFDPEFFEISTREAVSVDPQQRVLLEVTYEAIENANLTINKLSGSSTGVFIGISSSDYAQLQMKNNWDLSVYSGTGNASSIAANRISYNFNLTGPSLSVDTACSSSLVAIHLAVNSLRNGECEQAIVGGVNLILAPELTETFEKAGMMAADGKCKTFDARADGYVRGEGCGVVVLKSLEEAIADNNNILAVIEGSAINQDGRSNGLTAPSGKAQQKVVQKAWEDAQIDHSQINYIEAHGTGTSLGDPIELNSLGELMVKSDYNGHSLDDCWVGSAKTNIGHLESAAGIAGLIKTVLSLQHQLIPPTLNFKELNPYIDLEDTRLQIATSAVKWPSLSQTRFAGISSFGFGGTNAHVIVSDFMPKAEESPQLPSLRDRNQQILTLSAKNSSALQQLAQSYDTYLQNNPDLDIRDVCFTSNVGRSHFNHRLALVIKNKADLQEKIKSVGEKTISDQVLVKNEKVVFLFTGQGSQYSQMGYELYQSSNVFKETIDYCELVLKEYLDKPLTKIIFQEENKEELNQTIYTQPALFAIEYALAQLWLSWGIQPSIVMGHSVGEFVAATLAEVFSLEDGLKLIAHRGKLMQSLPLNGGMTCLFTNLETAEETIKNSGAKLEIAAVNGNNNIVISGDRQELILLEKEAQKEQIKFTKLKVSHAFHSVLMKPILAEFEKVAQEVSYNLPKLPVVSNVTATVNEEEIATAKYWVEHIIKPVKFAQSIDYLKRQDYQIFLEIGAKPTLLGMAKNLVENESTDNQFIWLPSLRKDKNDWQNILSSVGNLYELGFDFNWHNLYQGNPQRKLVKLPNYPWQNKRYWLGDSAVKKSKYLDCLYKVDWQEDSDSLIVKNDAAKDKQSYLIFANKEGVGEKLAENLSALNNNVYLVYEGESYQQKENKYWLNSLVKEDYQRVWQHFQENNIGIDKIIYSWHHESNLSSTLKGIDLEENNFLGCLPIVYLIQTLISSASKNSKLWLITNNAQKITQEEKINPQGGCLWGLGKVIAIEHPEYWGGIIDVNVLENNLSVDETKLLLTNINTESPEKMIAIRRGKNNYPRLMAKTIKSNDKINQVNEQSTYLITGGLGALGIKATNWLIQQGAKNIVLLGRSKPSEEVETQIKTWQTQKVNIFIANGDVSNYESLTSVFEKIELDMPPLKGIIHAAGVLADGILATLSAESFNKVMQPKIKGAWNLHQLTLDKSLDFFLLFSSVSSLLGSAGQGNYAAANAYLDAFANYRHSLNLPALSINWGAFDIGMATSTKNSLTSTGVELINPDEGIELLSQLINQSNSQIGVVKLNWQLVARKFPDLFNSPYLQNIATEFDESKHKKDAANTLLKKLKQASAENREDLIINYLKESISSILDVSPEKINSTDSLLDLGMDSLMVMEAINHLKTDLQLMLYPREFYERPRINALASYLADEFTTTHYPVVTENSTVTTKTQISNLIATPSLLTNAQNNKPTNHKPIAFILSSPRSGSTLLRVMLAGHPSLVSPPELHLLPFENMQQRQAKLEESHLGEGLIRAVMDLKRIDANTSQEIVNEWIKNNLSVGELYQILQNLSGDRLLIDKSPTYGMEKNTLFHAESIFSRAKYIHLVRHPYSVIESFARMRMDKLLALNNANPYEIGESIWQQTNQNIIDFSREIDSHKFYQLQYEDLVTQPEKAMKEVCEFLEIPFQDSVLNPYEGKRMTDGVHRQSMSVGDPNFNTRQTIDSKLAQHWQTIKLPISLNGFTHKLCETFDYDLPHDSQVETKALEMKEEYINFRDLNLCYCSWGKKDNPLIVLVHGILDQGYAWDRVAQLLASSGYYVVAPDLRGHGKSDHVGKGGSYNLLDFVADLDYLTSRLNSSPFTLVGHSLGSVVTGILTSMRPQKVKKLILIEPVLPVESNNGKDLNNIASHLEYLQNPPTLPTFKDVENVAKRMMKATPDLKEDFALKLAKRITKPYQDGVTFTYSPLLTTRAGIGFNSISRSSYLQLLSQIQSPVTIVYGDRSNFNRPEDLQAQQEAMQEAEKIILKGGHNLHLETPTDLASKILDNLKNLV